MAEVPTTVLRQATAEALTAVRRLPMIEVRTNAPRLPMVAVLMADRLQPMAEEATAVGGRPTAVVDTAAVAGRHRTAEEADHRADLAGEADTPQPQATAQVAVAAHLAAAATAATTNSVNFSMPARHAAFGRRFLLSESA